MRSTIFFTVSLLLGFYAHSAFALSTGVAADYNVFVFGSFIASNSDSEGNIAAGGAVNLSNYSVASNISGAGARLVVGGALTANSGGVGQGQNGTIYAGGSTNLSGFTASGGISAQNQVDFAAAQNQLQNLSTSWAALAANGTTTNTYGTLNLNGNDGTLNVFSVSGLDLTGTNSVNINVATGSTVLINVAGSGQTFQNGQVFLSGVDASRVLYNFSEASSLILAGSKNPMGTVFAPFADVSGGYGALDGQLIAKSFNGNIEFHDKLFVGSLPSATAVPVPAAAWLFGPALALIGAIGRKNKPI